MDASNNKAVEDKHSHSYQSRWHWSVLLTNDLGLLARLLHIHTQCLILSPGLLNALVRHRLSLPHVLQTTHYLQRLSHRLGCTGLCVLVIWLHSQPTWRHKHQPRCWLSQHPARSTGKPLRTIETCCAPVNRFTLVNGDRENKRFLERCLSTYAIKKSEIMVINANRAKSNESQWSPNVLFTYSHLCDTCWRSLSCNQLSYENVCLKCCLTVCADITSINGMQSIQTPLS